MSESQNPEETISTLRTQPSLLRRVHDWRDAASWEEFHRLYRNLIYGFARRAGLPHEDANEVVQDVLVRVARTIAQFESDPARGTFRGWLMNLTRWRIADKFNSRPKPERPRDAGPETTSTLTPTLERIPDPAPAGPDWDLEWQRHLLDAATERIRNRVSPAHFQVFDFYVRRRWSVREVARELGVNPATVYVIGFRLTRQLKAEVKHLSETLG